MVKNEIRIVGWDDCSHTYKQKKVTLVGVVFRGAKSIDGLLSTKITKDGFDATEKIAERIISSRHYDQLSVIMLSGITFGGFNVVDIRQLNKKTGLPVIAVLRKKPDRKRFFSAMKKLEKAEKRIALVKSAGKFYKFRDTFYQKCGLQEEDCRAILKVSCINGNIPEPVRVAHLIASGLSGDSHGRA